MGPNDINQWVEEYSPVFNRAGLIVDVRHNRGGNIDSWVLGKLMRKAWMYWQPRSGRASWNMQEAFRGPVVVLCDQWTASDGEAFSEGFRRLGLGKVIGTRTWGGEIWLSASNRLADNGIARAGLIVDIRHNRGGKIDSWVLGKLMRKVWIYWQPRAGRASWNMQEAFRGPVVVLCEQWTASDGEAFSEAYWAPWSGQSHRNANLGWRNLAQRQQSPG